MQESITYTPIAFLVKDMHAMLTNELCDDDEINRAIIWKKGRINKEGGFDGDELNMAVDKIDEYIQKKREGTLQITGPKEDILTKALDSREQGGRVRAIGGHITPTLYFNVGRIWRNDGVEKNLMIDQKKELIEAKKLIAEQDERQKKESIEARKIISEQDERIKKLEAVVYKKSGWENEIDEKGSCSVKLPQLNENQLKVEKSFNIDEDLDDLDIQIVEKSTALQGKSVVLTLESGMDVAYGTVVELNGASKLLHGIPLPQNCMRVSIDIALEKSARLPVLIPNECEIVGDAVGTHVAWPKDLIVVQENRMKKKICHEENRKDLASNVPRSVRLLYCYCKRALDNGRKLSFLLDHGVFEDEYELNLHLEDINPLYHLEEITGNCVVVYVWYLYQKMGKENKIDKFRFVNPHSIPNWQRTTYDKIGKTEQLNRRASSLADRLSSALVNQFILVPSCSSGHWILTVIEPYKEVVYLFDSLSHRIRDEDWKYVVEMALRLFKSNKGRKGRKHVQWVVIQAPRQPDAKQCGYYVLRFMRQIIEKDATIEGDSLREMFTKKVYSREEIDEVRSELAECIQDHIYD
ncbi:uncharacterized protein [Henckelia pumila]|uniref:uncharacterized protein isoform X1 n=1 Tax=Henckelia pumila TaxID=405737 RepID=UPI003C6DEB4A